VARFAARWPHFSVAPETAALLASMVAAGEVDALVPERVWQELSRGLMAAKPSRMLDVLAECGALPRLLPELQGSRWAWPALDGAAAADAVLEERYALLGFGDAAAASAVSRRLRAPNECEALAVAYARERAALAAYASTPHQALALLERCDALRRPGRFTSLLYCAAWQQAAPAAALAALRRAHQAALGAASAAAAAAAQAGGACGRAVGAAVHEARRSAIEQAWAQAGADSDTGDVPTSPP
jgi:tRNA nucleotidyltransferase (CCA-adding enzyme)